MYKSTMFSLLSLFLVKTSAKMKKFLIRLILVLSVVYIGICGYMFFFQESFIFHPEVLAKNEVIDYGLNEAELSIETEDGEKLSGILSKSSAESKKLVFFLHGNSGNLTDQAQAAKFYTELGFDFFTFDYRGFGKSSGKIKSEEQFYEDIERMYDEMLSVYSPDSIIVVGYSVGTAPAAMIANRAKPSPSKLVLIAPYYSMIDMTARRYPFIPSFLLEYKFETDKFVSRQQMPIFIIHGDKDEVLPVDGSRKLSKLLNEKSSYYEIKGQGHDDFELNAEFKAQLSAFL